MGTKNNPSKFDCYANAEPDEPMFILLARDGMAPFLVSIWSKLRVGDSEAATVVFEKLVREHCMKYGISPDVEQSAEALDCSLDMFRWRKEHRS
jgi:hypothetical protein